MSLARHPLDVLKLGLIVNKTADDLVVFHDNEVLPVDDALMRAAREGDEVGVLACCFRGNQMPRVGATVVSASIMAMCRE